MRVGRLTLAFVVSAAASLLGILILHAGTYGGVEMLDLALTTIEKREWILSGLGIGTVCLALPPFLILLDPEHPQRAEMSLGAWWAIGAPIWAVEVGGVAGGYFLGYVLVAAGSGIGAHLAMREAAAVVNSCREMDRRSCRNRVTHPSA